MLCPPGPRRAQWDAAALHYQGPSRKGNKCCENTARFSPQTLMTVASLRTHTCRYKVHPGRADSPQQRALTRFSPSTLLLPPSAVGMTRFIPAGGAGSWGSWGLGPRAAAPALQGAICPSPETSIAQYSPVQPTLAEPCIALYGPSWTSTAQCSPARSSMILHGPAQPSTAQQSTAQCSLAQQSPAEPCMVLYEPAQPSPIPSSSSQHSPA